MGSGFYGGSKFAGTYASLAALQAAWPSAIKGKYAIVDAGAGSSAQLYLWDEQEGWISTGIDPAELAAKANDADVIHKTGDETKAGILTLSSAPVFSTGATMPVNIDFVFGGGIRYRDEGGGAFRLQSNGAGYGALSLNLMQPSGTAEIRSEATTLKMFCGSGAFYWGASGFNYYVLDIASGFSPLYDNNNDLGSTNAWRKATVYQYACKGFYGQTNQGTVDPVDGATVAVSKARTIISNSGNLAALTLDFASYMQDATVPDGAAFEIVFEGTNTIAALTWPANIVGAARLPAAINQYTVVKITRVPGANNYRLISVF